MAAIRSDQQSFESAKKQPLLLKHLQPFGIGGRRLCFAHPHDPAKCVKVLRQDERRTVRIVHRSGIPAKLRRQYDNNADEMRTLNALFHRIGADAAQHLPESFGMYETDMGLGLVLTLVRDADQRISRSLRELLSTGFDASVFRPAFDQLSEFLQRHVVITRALLDHNIVARHRADGTWQLYLIDGLGDPAWLPLGSWFPRLGRARVQRRTLEAWSRFEKFQASGGVTPELIQASSWGQGFLLHRGD